MNEALRSQSEIPQCFFYEIAIAFKDISIYLLEMIDVRSSERNAVLKRADPYRILLDYDDLLTICEQALEANEALLRRYQNRYDYVLTDESQDTSLVQNRIVEKLVRPHGNLCVVADDDQSIYSWRGAEPAYLLNFRKRNRTRRRCSWHAITGRPPIS
jgi:superfamily I DNA/RNA helicase